MLTENYITISAPASRVFDLAADVLSWPGMLPHYRWVKLISEDGRKRVVEMAAHRDGIPVKWTSIQEPIPDALKIVFLHIKGPTRGMYVEWNINEEGPLTHVRITHEFDPPWPLVGRFIARHIVGGFFVHNIAGKTLSRIKEVAEGEANR